MISTGTLLRMFGTVILLIAVQFASVATEAHAGHGYGPDRNHLQGHSFQAHSLQAHGAAAGVPPGSFDETAPAEQAAQVQPAAQVVAAVQNAPGGPLSETDACGTDCTGCAGCCAAALVVDSVPLSPKACLPRIGFARVMSVRGVDPRGLRKPPRSFA